MPWDSGCTEQAVPAKECAGVTGGPRRGVVTPPRERAPPWCGLGTPGCDEVSGCIFRGLGSSLSGVQIGGDRGRLSLS